MKTQKLPLVLLLSFSLITLFSCHDDDLDYTTDDDSVSVTADVPDGAALIVDKNFQSSGEWPSKDEYSIGYDDGSDSCATDGITAITEAVNWSEIYYNGVNNDTVNFTYTDVALNTTCDDGAGTSVEGEDISAGYVIFPEKSSRSGAVDPEVELSEMNYVSVVQFTLSTLSTSGSGISLYKSVDGADYELVGTFLPESSSQGQYYSVAIDESDVALKFVSEDSDNGFILMHDLEVWTDGVPDGSELYVEDYFYSWNLWGYELPVPGVESNPTGTQYVPLARTSTVELDTTITYREGTPITYTIHDGAVNPDCYNHHGDTTLVYGLTTGYLEMPINDDSYTNQDIDASITISAVPSVSLIEFWVAVTGMAGHYQLYKSVDGGDYELYKDMIVTKYSGIGKYYRFYVNEENVSFRFTPYEGDDAYSTTPKLYGLRIWSNGTPE